MAQEEALFPCRFLTFLELYSLSYHIEIKIRNKKKVKKQDKKLTYFRILEILNCYFLSQTVLLTRYP